MKKMKMTLQELKDYIFKDPNLKWVFYRGKNNTDADDIKSGRFEIEASTAWTGDWEKKNLPAKEYDRIAHWNDHSQVLYVGGRSTLDPKPSGDRWKMPIANVTRIEVTPRSKKPVGLKKLVDKHPQIFTYLPDLHNENSLKPKKAETPKDQLELNKALNDLDHDAKTAVLREVWCRTNAHRKFKESLLNQWGNRCALTSLDVDSLLVASHIKPWKDSKDAERIDPNNGLLLIAPIDRLFDGGFLTFNDEGDVILHKSVDHPRYLSDETLAAFGLNRERSDKLSRTMTEKQKKFMRYHRQSVFLR